MGTPLLESGSIGTPLPRASGERLVSSLLSRNMNQLELASPEYSSVARIKSNQCLCRNTHQLDRLTSNYVSSVRWIAPPLKDVSNQSNRINRINRSSSIGDLTHTRDVVCFGVYRLHVFGILRYRVLRGYRFFVYCRSEGLSHCGYRWPWYTCCRA